MVEFFNEIGPTAAGHERPLPGTKIGTSGSERVTKSPGGWPGLCARIEREIQFALRRLMRPTPATPRPSKVSVAGSGTPVGGVVTTVAVAKEKG
jgi:hypothetical protein